MNNILTVQQAVQESENLRSQNKKVVLVGGCFDILHQGHIEFLEKAQKHGDVLFVLLESDEKIKKIKGDHRPINTQAVRAKILSAIRYVDYIVLMPQIWTNHEYDDIITKLEPALIATTEGDPYREHKERQAKLLGSSVIDVMRPIADQSTSRIAKMLSEEL